MYKLLLYFAFILNIYSLKSQTLTPTYAEKLGYPKGAKVVIMHVDDVGMSYDSNEGAIQALEKGVANSLSMMMPCPWVPSFMHYLKEHPSVDAGIHLTLTSEWKNYRWHPLTGYQAAKGLVDTEGAFHHSVEQVVKNASADEVEAEMRAQIARFRLFGLEPTHLDSHMGTLFATPAFTERYIKVGISEHIPIMFPGGHCTVISQLRQTKADDIKQYQAIGEMLWAAGLPVLDDLHPDSYSTKPPKDIAASDEKLKQFRTDNYIDILKSLKPGVTMVIMHCAFLSNIYQHISADGAVRKGDWLAMLDPRLKEYIQKEGIILTTWRELKARRDKVK